jgi:hypothetical protein
MPWFGWLLIVAAILTFVAAGVGRWLQAKGRSVERHRD